MSSKCECFAVLDETDPRAPIWREIVPDFRIPLKQPLMHKATVPDGSEKHFLEGNPDKLSDFQKARFVELMAQHFDVSEKYAFDILNQGILPVLADNITVVICNLHTRCML